MSKAIVSLLKAEEGPAQRAGSATSNRPARVAALNEPIPTSAAWVIYSTGTFILPVAINLARR